MVLILILNSELVLIYKTSEKFVSNIFRNMYIGKMKLSLTVVLIIYLKYKNIINKEV